MLFRSVCANCSVESTCPTWKKPDTLAPTACLCPNRPLSPCSEPLACASFRTPLNPSKSCPSNDHPDVNQKQQQWLETRQQCRSDSPALKQQDWNIYNSLFHSALLVACCFRFCLEGTHTTGLNIPHSRKCKRPAHFPCPRWSRTFLPPPGKFPQPPPLSADLPQFEKSARWFATVCILFQPFFCTTFSRIPQRPASCVCRFAGNPVRTMIGIESDFPRNTLLSGVRRGLPRFEPVFPPGKCPKNLFVRASGVLQVLRVVDAQLVVCYFV